MGCQEGAQEKLFYAFNLEDHVPQNHLLRGIDRFLDLTALRQHLSQRILTGIDPNQPVDLAECCHWRYVVNGHSPIAESGQFPLPVNAKNQPLDSSARKSLNNKGSADGLCGLPARFGRATAERKMARNQSCGAANYLIDKYWNDSCPSHSESFRLNSI